MSEAIAGVMFDAYGTLFDVYAVEARLEALFPGKGRALALRWRDKQIDYSRLRTLSGRYADFWSITGDALDYASEFERVALCRPRAPNCSPFTRACRPIRKSPRRCAPFTRAA